MERITATEASRNFSKILDRTEHQGDTFIVERNGEPVAEIRPAPPRTTLGELLRLFDELAEKDPTWVEDMRKVRAASRRDLPRGCWPDDAE